MTSDGTEHPPFGKQGLSYTTLAWSDTPFAVHDTIARTVISEDRTVHVEGTPVSLPLPWTGFLNSFGLIHDRLVVGFGRWAELRVYAPTGTLEEVIRSGAMRQRRWRLRIRGLTAMMHPDQEPCTNAPRVSQLSNPA